MATLKNLIGEVLDGKYRIDRLLGEGGMGAVFLATHLGTDRPVAVKVIAPQFMANDEFVERFKREARAAGRLRHPNVVDVTDFGFAQVGPARVAYLVMEYLDGCTLGEVLAEEKQLPLPWVVDILEQACSAVEEAHRQGILHRDLKPDNIWLEPNGRGGFTVKVLDFGLAKLGDTDSIGSFPTTLFPAPSEDRSTADPRTATLAADPAAPASLKPAQAATTQPEEAVTMVMSAPPLLEQQTLILPAQDQPVSEGTPAITEASTQILPAIPLTVEPPDNPNNKKESKNNSAEYPAEAVQTLLMDNQTPTNLADRTASAMAALTHAGSILGTPLYMSPEQCRGELLDARSDIYSLGVIAYQMLGGITPFTGDMQTVMKAHLESPPPSLRERRPKLARREAELIMSTLAKEPAKRPQTAAAFASALRAYAENSGTLLRRAFALYSEHFPSFFRVSLILHLPLLILTIAELTSKQFGFDSALSFAAKLTLTVVPGVLLALGSLFIVPVLTGVVTMVVIQLLVTPLTPVEIRPAFAEIKSHLWPFIMTILAVICLNILGFALCIIPGLYFLVVFALYPPVMIIEGLYGRKALRRSKELAKRVWPTVILILFIQFVIPLIYKSLLGVLVDDFSRHLMEWHMMAKEDSIIIAWAAATSQVVASILVNPVIAILSALLYLKTRQAGGEQLQEALSHFHIGDSQRSKWQIRMHERLQISGRTSVGRGKTVL